jgi:hypothetical protein
MSELAWAAGFLDGEGSFGVYRKAGRRNLIYLQASQCDRRVLDRLQQALGAGKVYGPYEGRRKGWRTYYYFRLTGAKTHGAAEKIWPWLSEVKREQYEATREHEGQLHGGP